MEKTYEVIPLDFANIGTAADHTHGLKFGVYEVSPPVTPDSKPLKHAVCLCYEKAEALRICALLKVARRGEELRRRRR